MERVGQTPEPDENEWKKQLIVIKKTAAMRRNDLRAAAVLLISLPDSAAKESSIAPNLPKAAPAFLPKYAQTHD